MLAEARDVLNITALMNSYQSGEHTPREVFACVMSRIASYDRKGVWITVLSAEQIEQQLLRLEANRKAGKPLPLFGVPFAVKDNIDVAGIPTTAACPAFAYTPDRSATVVERLCDAGAIVVGKTNLDQFATGLVGTRSPYGACQNAIKPEYISGGSSAGSAVAVAGDLVSFSLGTDTAGSGRVPASFNNLVGLKPTRGLLSTTGVVPACRTLDCVSIFSKTCEEAEQVLSIAAGFDPLDPLSRSDPKTDGCESFGVGLRVGIPAAAQLEFFGNQEAADLFQQAITRTKQLGATITEIDYTPFAKTAALLYEGPWVAERLLAAGKLLHENPDALRPELRAILSGATRYTAADVFSAQVQLAALRRDADAQWQEMDIMLLPTTGTIYKIAEVDANPLQLNKNLGYYTNFVNLLDLSAVAVPNGLLSSGLPMGITFLAPAFSEKRLLHIGSAFHALAERIS
ncbi:MAG TPA: allophanate hydrolase [Phycisphaerae bacterium]|nr:allophanate hydrolase [Phycisphaerae bacterium]